jgi:hypothetical protein
MTVAVLASLSLLCAAGAAAASAPLGFKAIVLAPSARGAAAARLRKSTVVRSAATGGLKIIPNYDDASWHTFYYCEPVATAPNAAALEATISQAISQFEALYSNPITVHVVFCVTSFDGGESETIPAAGYTYSEVRAALAAHQTTEDQASAVASLPASDPTRADGAPDFEMSYPEAEALGLTTPPLHEPVDTSVAVLLGVNSVSVAEHEISEVLGRIPGLDLDEYYGEVGHMNYMPDDLFRYTAPGVRGLTPYLAGTYLSLNGGVTNLVEFNSNVGGDPQDYAGRTHDAFNAFGNGLEPLTTAGLANMDALGYDRTAASVSLKPASASLSAGEREIYKATGTDALGNNFGSVTAHTTLTIAPAGSGSATGASCEADTCSATASGTYTVTGTDGPGSGTATLKVSTACTANSGTVTMKPGLTNTPAVQTVKIKGTLKGCKGEPFTEVSYGATLTTGPVSCSVLTGPGKTATGTAKYQWTPKAKPSSATGLLSLVLSEAPSVAFSGETTAGSFSPLTFSGTATESYEGGPTCGVPNGKKAAKAVKKGTFTGTTVSFE